MKDESLAKNHSTRNSVLTAVQRREIEKILLELETIRKQEVTRMMRMAGGRIVLA